jgi:hypothetical protein
MKCPVAIFAYKRPLHLKRVVDSVRCNPEAVETDLFIFCDGAAHPDDESAVLQVRELAKAVNGFRSVTVVERETNYGLSRSITEGVGRICSEYGRTAVIEDDVLVSSCFLSWINVALDKYENEERVMSVGCYVYPTRVELPETFFLSLPDCWGWAVWQRSWLRYRSDGAVLLKELHARNLTYFFDFEGAYPYTNMLSNQVRGENDSWAIKWSASVLLAGGLTIYPKRSMTQNIGFDGSGTNCDASRAYFVELSERLPELNDIPLVESEGGREAWRQFFLTLNPPKANLSIIIRLLTKIRRLLN